MWYPRARLQEWYADGPLGLEQGFTIVTRPGGAGSVLLGIGDVPRGMRPVLAGDGRSMTFEDRGREALRYSGLVASDATGRLLPARIVVDGRAVSLRVDDRGARYPLRIVTR